MRFAYVRHIWECGDSLEIEEKHTGRYGASGQKRQKERTQLLSPPFSPAAGRQTKLTSGKTPKN